MQVHRLEDYRIHNRQGRSRGTGGYYVNRMGHKKETMVYSVYYAVSYTHLTLPTT